MRSSVHNGRDNAGDPNLNTPASTALYQARVGESTLKAKSTFWQRKRTSNLSEVTFCYATSYIVALLATILNIYFSTDKFAFEIPRLKCEVDLC